METALYCTGHFLTTGAMVDGLCKSRSSILHHLWGTQPETLRGGRWACIRNCTTSASFSLALVGIHNVPLPTDLCSKLPGDGPCDSQGREPIEEDIICDIRTSLTEASIRESPHLE